MKFNNLLRESQFHGGKWLVETKFRCYWAVALAFLFCCSVTVIYDNMMRFISNPTYLVQFEEVQDNIEFPSVLICPEVAFTRIHIDSFLSNINIPPGLNRTYLKQAVYYLAAFFSPDVPFKLEDLVTVEQLLKYNNMDLDTAGRLLTTSCEDSFSKCQWNGLILNCFELFEMELTGDGYCCVFNGRSLKRHKLNKSTQWKVTQNLFGPQSGLMFAVNQIQNPFNIDLAYKWLVIQSSQHFVESSVNGTALSPGTEIWIDYSVKLFQIDDRATGLGESLIKCRLDGDTTEKPLKYFPEYLKRYCNVECEMQRILKHCKCVSIVHPKLKGVNTCGARELLCVRHAKVTFDSQNCDCPMPCKFVNNMEKMSHFNLMPNSHPLSNFYDGLNFEKTTVVRVFISDFNIKTDSRWSYYTHIDLFAQLGGFFNVFFGCSVLTILELFLLVIHGINGIVRKLNH